MTTKLTDTQKQTIRIALAKWAGWTSAEPVKEAPYILWGIDPATGHPSKRIPNYPASLDACHEIEVKLTEAEHKRFRERLLDLIPKGRQRDYVGIQRNQVAWQSRCYVSASAEHRSLALFRALNLGELGD